MSRGDVDRAGDRMLRLATDLYPICRSITGDGVRATLRAIGAGVPLDIHEVPSGTPVLDWTIPDEWNIRDAYITAPDGRQVARFADSNLHVVSYSTPVAETMTLEELRGHLHVDGRNPAWIPYRTSYYTRTWGFCLAERELEQLEPGLYDVLIDSTLGAGSLTYAECVIPGESTDEVLLSTHVCHPSLANDNLSGIAVLAELASALRASTRRYTYRLLFAPGTIGAITWLARNEEHARRAIVAGLVLACLGDSRPLTYKRSQRGDSIMDWAAAHVVSGRGGRVLDFTPWGWDERQFNSPGFDLAVGCITRSLESEFPEYHSSADDLSLITPEALQGSLEAVLEMLDVLEGDRTYVNVLPRGEPQLGKRGLYRGVGGPHPDAGQLAQLWVLNQSNGARSLAEIAERSGMPFTEIEAAAARLREAGLLAEVSTP